MQVVRRWGVGCCLVLATVVASARASAAPPWVERPLTLPRLVFAGDVGIGVAHRDLGNALVCIGGAPCVYGPGGGRNGITGVGANLEAAFGITDSVEMRLRTGVRFGTDGKLVPADALGRTLWTETYGTEADRIANPELGLRWAVHSGSTVEIGLDGRAYLPTEQGSSFGMMVGLPIAFHIANLVRIDTGLYGSAVFSEQRALVVSVPIDVWFQVSRHVWLGPMSAFRRFETNDGIGESRLDWLLGFGGGVQVANAVDLKAMFLLPRANDNDTFAAYGFGFGLQFRIGE